MKITKIILLIILIITLTLVTAIFSSSATDGPYYAEPIDDAPAYYTTVADALSALENGGRLSLTDDITVDEPIILNSDVIFDLNGYTLTNTSSAPVFSFAGGALNGCGKIITSGPLASGNNSGDIKISGSEYGIHILCSSQKIFDMAGGSLYLSSVEIISDSENAEFAHGANYVNIRNTETVMNGGIAFSGVCDSIDICDASFSGMDSFLVGNGDSSTEVSITDSDISSKFCIFDTLPNGLITANNTKLILTGDDDEANAVFSGARANIFGGFIISGNGVDRKNSNIAYDSYVSFELPTEDINYIASVNGKGYSVLEDALHSAFEKGTYVKLESDVSFSPKSNIHGIIYTDGYNLTIPNLSSKISVTSDPLYLSDSVCGYSVSIPLFAVRHEDGTEDHYYSQDDLKSLSNDYSNSELLFKNNDTIILYGDITTDKTFEIENYLGTSSETKITFDVNGHTFTSEAEQTFTAGNNNNNRSSVEMNLYVCSSSEGGVINTNQDGCFFKAVGKNKNLTVNGENLTLNTNQLLYGINGSKNHSEGTVVLNGGIYNQTSAAAFIYSDSSKFNNTNIIYSPTVCFTGGATINIAEGGALIDMTDIKSFSTYSPSTYTIENATVNLNGGTLLDFTHYRADLSVLILNNKAVINGTIPTAGRGKIVLNSGAVYTYVTDEINSYSEQTGTYFGANELTSVKYNYATANEVQQYAVALPTEIKNAEYLDIDNNRLSYFENYYIDAILPIPDYTAPSRDAQTFTLIHNGWEETISETLPKNFIYIPEYNISPKNPEIQASASIHNGLIANIYLHNSFYEHLDSDEKENYEQPDANDSDASNYRVTSIAMPINTMFAGIDLSMTFCENIDGVTYRWTYTENFSVFEYACRTMMADISSDANYLMYHLLEYIESSYQFVRISANEIEAIGNISNRRITNESDARIAVKELIENTYREINALTGFEPTNAYSGTASQYQGEMLNLEIALDLLAYPTFVISPKNSNIKSIKINGVQITSKDESGNYLYSSGALYNFDTVFEISTHDAYGNEISKGSFGYANYVYAVNRYGNAKLISIVSDLYGLILAAEAYKDTLN